MKSRPTKNGTAGFDASGPKGRRPAHTYLLGFDAACIALCRACFDQLAKAVLLKGRTFREAELRKGHLTLTRPRGPPQATQAHRGCLRRTRRSVSSRPRARNRHIAHDSGLDPPRQPAHHVQRRPVEPDPCSASL